MSRTIKNKLYKRKVINRKKEKLEKVLEKPKSLYISDFC
jgi:hypothetical protein